jgi:PhoH-like ATPase
MTKNFVLDTNVLLHDASSLHAFGNNHVVIPIYVIEELDNFKKDLSELGRNARQVSRTLDKMRNDGSLTEGVSLPDGGTLRVAFTETSLPKKYSNTHQMDNSILATALGLQDSEPERPCVFISMDTNLRIRAEAVGLDAEDYDKDHIDISELYTGWLEVTVEDRFITLLNDEGQVPINDMLNQDELDEPIYENQYLLARAMGNPSNAALCRLSVSDNQVHCLPRMRDGVWGIRARNKEQHFALDALLNDDFRLVTLMGKAGTGKTLLAIAGGLARTTDAESYLRLLVSRPIFPLGRDIGYLPGSLEEKLNPWMQPIYDNVELLLGLSRQDKHDGRGYHELVDMGIIQIEPLTYIRGRSIPHQYLIVDEAQNLTPHEVKTIITRAGEGTKVVLTGDPYQIDNPYVDSVNNGLTYVVNRFREEPIAAHVTLLKGERSELAELAANLL